MKLNSGLYFYLTVAWISLLFLFINGCSVGDKKETTTQFILTDSIFVQIDLSNVVNRGFLDEYPNDHKGEWTDFGSLACFKHLPAGLSTFQDSIVPFYIIDPQHNNGKSALILSGPQREDYFPKISDTIHVDGKFSSLFFLNTTMYPLDSEDTLILVEYHICYEDGTEEKFALRRNIEIDDWWDTPKRMQGAIRTYNENELWLINTPWKNPFPQKKIDWIRMVSTGNAIPILLAVTGSVTDEPHNVITHEVERRIKELEDACIHIALIQPMSESNQEINLKKGIEFCRKAKAMGADIVLFPEMYNIGYTSYDPDIPGDLEDWIKKSVDKKNRFVTTFQDLAKELNMAIAISYLETREGYPRNTTTLFDHNGNIAVDYSKVHTCDFIPMETATTPGDGFFVSELSTRLGPVKVGMMICYDREAPESARILMLKGAELILTPNACNLHKMLLQQFQVRAYENALAVVMANYAGGDERGFNGHSCAFDARGNELLMAGEEEGVYMFELNLVELREYRAETIYGNAYRRPHKYDILVSDEVREPFERLNGFGEKFDRTKR